MHWKRAEFREGAFCEVALDQHNRLVDIAIHEPHEVDRSIDAAIKVEPLLARLNPRRRWVVERRFGLFDGIPYDVDEIARIHWSRDLCYVRQILTVGLAMLRRRASTEQLGQQR